MSLRSRIDRLTHRLRTSGSACPCGRRGWLDGWGPIFGAAIVVIMKNVVSAYIERWNLVLGVIFILIISFMPEGLVPGSVRLWRAGWRSRAKASGPAAACCGRASAARYRPRG